MHVELSLSNFITITETNSNDAWISTRNGISKILYANQKAPFGAVH